MRLVNSLKTQCRVVDKTFKPTSKISRTGFSESQGTCSLDGWRDFASLVENQQYTSINRIHFRVSPHRLAANNIVYYVVYRRACPCVQYPCCPRGCLFIVIYRHPWCCPTTDMAVSAVAGTDGFSAKRGIGHHSKILGLARFAIHGGVQRTDEIRNSLSTMLSPHSHGYPCAKNVVIQPLAAKINKSSSSSPSATQNVSLSAIFSRHITCVDVDHLYVFCVYSETTLILVSATCALDTLRLTL